MANIKRTPTEDPVIDRIEELLKLHKKTKKDLLAFLGLESSMFTKWRYEGGKSYMKYIVDISNYLHVSVEYLLNGISESDTMIYVDKEELNLIKSYRILDSYKKELVINLVNVISA